jgi:hypothetical protein
LPSVNVIALGKKGTPGHRHSLFAECCGPDTRQRRNLCRVPPKALGKGTDKGACRRFNPGGSLDRRVNCCCVPQPRWVGARRDTKGGKPRPRVVLRRSGCACSRGYKRSRGRERESRATTLSYEGPDPSFYRCKERVQVYNGGVAIC